MAELRTARRLARTWVFAALAVGLNLAIFAFYAYVEASYSPDLTLGRLSPRLLMGQFGVYLLTTVLAGVIFLACDIRARDRGARLTEVLYSSPPSNLVFVAGQVAALALTAWLTVLAALVVVQCFGVSTVGLWGVGSAVEPFSLATFALVDALPASVFWCSTLGLLAAALRNRLAVAVAPLVILGVVVWCAPRIPVYLVDALVPVSNFADFASDLVPRFASIETLLQRLSMLVGAAGLVAVAAAFQPRSDGLRRRHLVWGVGLATLGASGIALLLQQAMAGMALREDWLELHSRAANDEAITRPDVERLTGDVIVDPGSKLALEVSITLRAPETGPQEVRALVFSLNPGLHVTALDVDGLEAEFTHQHGLLSVALATPMQAGSRAVLFLRAVGVPDGRFGYLDGEIDPLRVSASNRIGSLGREAAIFEDAYVGLMPAVHWLPAAGANAHRDDPARRTRDFFEVQLTIRAPEDWLVVAVGRRQRIGPGIFRFESKVPVSEVGLFASRFERQAIEVDGVDVELLMHTAHSDVSDLFAEAGDVLRPRLEEMQRRLEKLGIGYPFDSLSVVEVPMRLRAYRGGWRMETQRGPPSVVVISEYARVQIPWRHRAIRSNWRADLDDAEFTYSWLWNLVFDLDILDKYTSNLLATTGASREGAAALDAVCRELALALLLGETRHYLEVANSAHAMNGEDGLGSLLAGAVSVLFADDRGPVFGHSLSFSDRPQVWEHALATSLADVQASGAANWAVEALSLKSSRAADAIFDRFGRDKVGALLAGLRRGYAGRTFGAEDFVSVGEEVGVDVESLLGDWLRSTAAPGLLASPVEVVRLRDDESGNPRYQARVHVRNDEPVLGAAFLGVDRQAWMDRTEAFPITGNSSVELAMVMPEPPTQLWLHTYFSQNRIPVRLEIPTDVDHTGEQTTTVTGARPSDWRPAPPEGIVIDDLDPGFAVEPPASDWRGGFMARFRPEIQFDRGLPQHTWALEGGLEGLWFRREVPSSWGKYRHTMALSAGGNGDRRVAFVADLDGGRWRLDFHVPRDPLPQWPGGRYAHPSFIGLLGHYEMWIRTAAADTSIEFDGSAAEQGWNKLGIFELAAGSVSVVVSNRTTGDLVIVDAIRWLPVPVADAP